MSSVLIQNLPVVDEAPFQFLSIQQPVYHLKVGGPPCGGPTPTRAPRWLLLPGLLSISIRPGLGRATRLCVFVLGVGVRTVTSHFFFKKNEDLFSNKKIQLCSLRRTTPTTTFLDRPLTKLYPTTWNEVHVDEAIKDDRGTKTRSWKVWHNVVHHRVNSQ